MLGDFWIFLTAIGIKWWGFVTALLFGGIAETVGYVSPSLKARIDTWAPPARRRGYVLIFMFVAFAYASFSAFEDEHKARLAAEAAAQNQRAIVSGLQRALSTKPKIEQQVVTKEIPAPAPPLSRDVKLEVAAVTFDSLNAAGTHAASAADIQKTDMTGTIIRLQNIGPTTVHWQLDAVIATTPSGLRFTTAEKKSGYISAGDKAETQLRFSTVREIARSDDSIRLQIVLSYDTAPPTGKRVSRVDGKMIVAWIPPQPNNNTVDLPSTAGFTVTSDKES